MALPREWRIALPILGGALLGAAAALNARRGLPGAVPGRPPRDRSAARRSAASPGRGAAGAPVRYTPDLERHQPGEEKVFREIEQTFNTILETTSTDYGHAVRAVHAKAHGLLEGTLRIADGLPPEFAQGMFARPGEHRAILRLSTNAGDILPDVIGLPRGIALKVFDVEGERLAEAEGTAQDFVMVNGPVFQAKTADQFLGGLKLLAKTTDRIEGTKKAVSVLARGVDAVLGVVGVHSSTLRSFGSAPNVDPLGETYYSVTPFRYGEHIAKFSLVPVSSDLKRLTGTRIDARDRPDAIREKVRREMAAITGVWALRVQLCRDPQKQPIEDPTVEWKEADSPFETVATLQVGPQDSWADDKVRTVDEQMRFSVWTGLAAHQPLGNINRARKDTYRHSADFRQRFNGCPIHEPGKPSA